MLNYKTSITIKVTACEMLVCFARELKEHFINYVVPVLELMLPLTIFVLHDGVRSGKLGIIYYFYENNEILMFSSDYTCRRKY